MRPLFRRAHSVSLRPGILVSSVRQCRRTRRETRCRAPKWRGRVFANGIPEQDLAPVGENLRGAENAVTAWVDHQQQIKGDRYVHALLGDGDKLKARALVQATSLCEPAPARS